MMMSQLLEKAGNMKGIRAIAAKHPQFREAVIELSCKAKNMPNTGPFKN